MRQPSTTKQFEQDWNRATRRGYDLSRARAAMRDLAAEKPLAPRHQDHPLKGESKDHRECHIQPDWLPIYRTTATTITYVRTGTHADLFGKYTVTPRAPQRGPRMTVGGAPLRTG
jgi:mRNA interferase YafQ